MNARPSQPDGSSLRGRRSFIPQNDRQEQLRTTLREVYGLLEQYAPSWWPQRLYNELEAILQSLEPAKPLMVIQKPKKKVRKKQ